jgi:hypothetical protein
MYVCVSLDRCCWCREKAISPPYSLPKTGDNQQYAVDDEIAGFVSKTAVIRDTCDTLAKDLVGGDQVVPVAVQEVCSYTVYAGQGLGYVVQFRLKSLGAAARPGFRSAWSRASARRPPRPVPPNHPRHARSATERLLPSYGSPTQGFW